MADSAPTPTPPGPPPASPANGSGDIVRWRHALVPLLGLAVVAAAALILLSQISPAAKKYAEALPSLLPNPDGPGFAAACLVWAAGAVALLAALAAIVGYAASVIIPLTAASAHLPPGCPSEPRRVRIVAAATVFGLGLLAGLASLGGSEVRVFKELDDSDLLSWPLAHFTGVANGLAGAAIASLFCAAAVLVGRRDRAVAMGLDPEKSLKRLLILGAVGTVLGVFEIGALHRLPAAAYRGSETAPGGRTELEAAILSALEDEAQRLMRVPAAEAYLERSSPLLSGWARAVLGDAASPAQVHAAVAHAVTIAKPGDAAWEAIRAEVVGRNSPTPLVSTAKALHDAVTAAALDLEVARVRTIQSSATAGATPVLEAWVAASLPKGAPVEQTRAAVASLVRTNPPDAAGWEAVRAAVAESLLAERDERHRKRTADAVTSLAAHIASYWGVVFSIALTLLYVPAAFILASEAEHRPVSAVRALAGETVTPGSDERRILQPLLAILAALAPLLAGAFAELFKAVPGLF